MDNSVFLKGMTLGISNTLQDSIAGQQKTESINTKQIPCFCVCGDFLLGFNIFCLTGFVCLFILIFLFLGERQRGENRKETKTERQMERKTQRDREHEFL